jgi:HEAT repeat protein
MASQLNEKNTRLRATAFYFVTRNSDDERVVPLLRDRLQDSDPQIRALATLDLVRRGHVPDLEQLQEVLDAGSGNYPFGARSSVGVLTGGNNLHRAIAPHATPEVFEWLLKAPPRLGEYDYRGSVFPQLGASLRRHPKAIDILLKVRDATKYDPLQRDFARDVFRMAGPDVLPQLHAALKSDDRVVRSNAARACGAIKDASSIEPLIQAADLESGLSRASIVWALGELKAKTALRIMATLYAEARAGEKRSNASGFRAGQQAAVVTSQYDRISNLESLASDWDELKFASLNPPVDPVRQEELLQPRHILEAVANIGPELSQEFYRALAASKDRDARQEAAEHLSAVPPADRARNAVVLKSLLTDSVLPIRIRAAVGLLLFGDKNGQSVIMEALNSKQEWEQRQTLEQLARLRNPSQRSFALARIKAIAADRLVRVETRQAANNLLK